MINTGLKIYLCPVLMYSPSSIRGGEWPFFLPLIRRLLPLHFKKILMIIFILILKSNLIKTVLKSKFATFFWNAFTLNTRICCKHFYSCIKKTDFCFHYSVNMPQFEDKSMKVRVLSKFFNVNAVDRYSQNSKSAETWVLLQLEKKMENINRHIFT